MKKLILLAALCGFFYCQNVKAICSNYTTYVDGQTLTAASLNSLQSNYTNCANGILDGDIFTGNMLWHSGADLNVYSDAGVTLKASIDGATGSIIGGLTQAGQVTNCGISVSGTTFTIAGYDGSSLSATNPCVVAVKSSTAGRVALAYFTSNVTFTFGATSDTDGNLFGITDANWLNTMPFFIGVIFNGTTPYFIISRVPLAASLSSSTDLCQKGDTDCDVQTDVMLLTTGATLSQYVSTPITQVGWFYMSYATSGSAWTARATNSLISAGFNFDYEKIDSDFPTGQNGAAASTYIEANGGTAPVFNTSTYQYRIDRTGACTLKVFLDADGGTDGSGSVALKLDLPFQAYDLGEFASHIDFPSLNYMALATLNSGQTYLTFKVPAVSGASLQNTMSTVNLSSFSNGNRGIYLNHSFLVNIAH